MWFGSETCICKLMFFFQAICSYSCLVTFCLAQIWLNWINQFLSSDLFAARLIDCLVANGFLFHGGGLIRRFAGPPAMRFKRSSHDWIAKFWTIGDILIDKIAFELFIRIHSKSWVFWCQYRNDDIRAKWFLIVLFATSSHSSMLFNGNLETETFAQVDGANKSTLS